MLFGIVACTVPFRGVEVQYIFLSLHIAKKIILVDKSLLKTGLEPVAFRLEV